MKLFIDTGSVAEVEEIAAWGVLSGATTNPTLLAKEEADPGETIRRIAEVVDGPVSAEVVSPNRREMVAEGRALAALHPHVAVKVPATSEGLAAASELRRDGIAINVTLVFSAAQALLAAEAGATYVSSFMGRVDDASIDSTAVLREIVEALHAGGSDTEVLAASIRSPMQVVTAARLGSELATVPAKVLRQMAAHPLTSAGLERFGADWDAQPQLGRWLDELVAVPA
jgi:transaldolase